MRLQTALRLKGYYQNTPTLKIPPMRRSQNTQNTRTVLKIVSETYLYSHFLLDSVETLLIQSFFFRQWINLKLSLTQPNKVKHTQEN